MLSQSAIREDVTNRVVAALQSGVVRFWRQTWAKSANSGTPTSAVSGKPYRGINRILLSLLGHESKWFATYAGWRSLGGQVRRGERGVTAILYKPVTKKKVNDDGEEEQSSFAFMKTFSLFHISQVDGDLSRFRDVPKPDSEPAFVDCGPAEEVFEATGADVRFGGGRAFYSPSHDYIQLPPKSAFSNEKTHEFYSVLAHETVHWSGHEMPRNKAILLTLYTGGFRVAELCSLKWSDLQNRDKAGQITVFGKRSKTRTVLMPSSVWNGLQLLRGDASDNAPVFRSRKGGHLDESQVWRIVSKASKRAGIEKEVSCHWLRHAHASHALDRGAPIHLVQQTLGHSSIASTGRYLHARPTDSSANYLPVG